MCQRCSSYTILGCCEILILPLSCIFFNLGAPPDVFSPTGQNWGFPTYNWEEMSKDNYKWYALILT